MLAHGSAEDGSTMPFSKFLAVSSVCIDLTRTCRCRFGIKIDPLASDVGDFTGAMLGTLPFPGKACPPVRRPCLRRCRPEFHPDR
jgi:hypothetical protein